MVPQHVLVLNASYEPINVCSVRRALVLLLKEKAEILEFLAGQVPKWWVPDDVVFLESLPVGGTGKVQKNELRTRYGGTFS